MPESISFKDYYLNYIPFDGFFMGHTHYMDFYSKNNKFLINPGSLGCTTDESFVSFSCIYPDENKITYYKIDVEIDNPLRIKSDEPELYREEYYIFRD